MPIGFKTGLNRLKRGFGILACATTVYINVYTLSLAMRQKVQFSEASPIGLPKALWWQEEGNASADCKLPNYNDVGYMDPDYSRHRTSC